MVSGRFKAVLGVAAAAGVIAGVAWRMQSGKPMDNSSRDHFAQELYKDMTQATVADEGWSIHVRRYDIPLPGKHTHTSIEIHGPERGDGTQFYSSLDTFNYGGLLPYANGSEMRMATDNNRGDNWVVQDKNLIQDIEIFSGSGAEALLRFAQITEQAMEFNTSGADYHKFSKDKDGIERANSNAGPAQILENLDYDVEGLGIRETDLGEGYSAPGADDEISSLFLIKEPGFFEAMGIEAAGALLDAESEAHKKLVGMMEKMHPDYIREQGVDNLPKPDPAAPAP